MKTILCIDDDPGMQQVLTAALESLGHRVLTATDPDTGLRLADSQPVDLVLLDLGLPGRNGFTVCHELRDHRPVPVLFVSGCSKSFSAKSEEFMALYEREFLCGMMDILYKPFPLDLLFEKVESLIPA